MYDLCSQTEAAKLQLPSTEVDTSKFMAPPVTDMNELENVRSLNDFCHLKYKWQFFPSEDILLLVIWESSKHFSDNVSMLYDLYISSNDQRVVVHLKFANYSCQA